MRSPDLVRTLVAFAVLAGAPPALSSDLTARLENGRALLQDNRCNGSCHQGLSDENDALAFYRRPDRKVTSFAGLERQVRFCVASLGSAIFPEDVGDVALALDHDHYRLAPAAGEAKP